MLPLVSYRHQAVLLWHSCWSVSRTALFRVPDGMGSRAVSTLPRQCGASSVLHAAQVSNVRFYPLAERAVKLPRCAEMSTNSPRLFDDYEYDCDDAGLHLCCARSPYTIQTIDPLCWPMDRWPRERGRIYGSKAMLAAQLIPAPKSVCSYLTCTLMEQRCWLKHVKATKLWSRACQQPPLASLS